MLARIAVALSFVLAGGSHAAAQKLIAHRGASADAPENTLAAFRLAFEQGADGIEGDYRLTSDGQIVCLHDPDTGRTGDMKRTVSGSTLAELQEVDLGLKKGAHFRGERIPTLAEVLATVPKGKEIFIEIKCGPEILPALERALKAAKLANKQITIISFDAGVIEAAAGRMPKIRCCWIVQFKADKSGWRPDLAGVIGKLKHMGAAGLDAGAPLAFYTPERVAAVRRAGLELHCWTVDDADAACRLSALGVDSLTTNRPAELRKALAARRPAK